MRRGVLLLAVTVRPAGRFSCVPTLPQMARLVEQQRHRCSVPWQQHPSLPKSSSLLWTVATVPQSTQIAVAASSPQITISQASAPRPTTQEKTPQKSGPAWQSLHPPLHLVDSRRHECLLRSSPVFPRVLRPCRHRRQRCLCCPEVLSPSRHVRLHRIH